MRIQATEEEFQMHHSKLNRRVRQAARMFMLLHCSFLFLHPAKAEIREPDNVLYGTITLNDGPVMATRTDVVIEARRLINGPPVASYRMGTNPRIGNFYALEVQLESVSPITNAAASQTGDTLI